MTLPETDYPAADTDPRVCRVCGCTDDAACDTITGPCVWLTTYDDNTGVCTACPQPDARRTYEMSGASGRIAL